MEHPLSNTNPQARGTPAATANEMANNLAQSNQYTTVTPTRAQELANHNVLVIAVQPHQGHGVPTISLYSGSTVLADYVAGAAATNPSKEYIYLNGSLLASYDGSAKYYLADHLSTRVTTDGTGAVTAEMGDYPFGEEWYATNGGTKWKFTNYERDGESGLDYAYARMSAPDLGRFTSADPIEGNGLAPQTLNGYAYAADDPVNLVDPSGAQCTLWIMGHTVTQNGVNLGTFIDAAFLTGDCGTLYSPAFPSPGGGGGNAKTPKKPPCSSDQNNRALKLGFINAHAGDAEMIASVMNTNSAFVLAQSALESTWGTWDVASNANNFFGLKVGKRFGGTISSYTGTDGKHYGVYDDPGYLNSGLSMANSVYGQAASGATSIGGYLSGFTTPQGNPGLTFNSTGTYAQRVTKILKDVNYWLPCLGEKP